MRVILSHTHTHTVVNIFVFPSLCLLRLTLSLFVSLPLLLLFFVSLFALLLFCIARFFTATFSVDFLTPDFLIGILYFRYVHYAFKCELSALLPSPRPPSAPFFCIHSTPYLLFCVAVGQLRKMLGNSMFHWENSN